MNKIIHYFLIATFIALIAACDSSKLIPLKTNDVIVAFGDSLTAGVGVGPADSYPSVLARLTGIKVINAGVSGETTADGLKRLPEVLEQHTPAILILLEGGNDILRNRNPIEIEHNLDQMIQLAKAKGIQVILIGVPEKSLFSNSAPFYDKLARKYDLVFNDDIIASLMRSPSKKSDAVHFNREGYREMAEEIFDMLKSQGAFD